jgi:hypothetical protein
MEARGSGGGAAARRVSAREAAGCAVAFTQPANRKFRVLCKCLCFYGVHIATTVGVGCDRGGGRRWVHVPCCCSGHVHAVPGASRVYSTGRMRSACLLRPRVNRLTYEAYI